MKTKAVIVDAGKSYEIRRRDNAAVLISTAYLNGETKRGAFAQAMKVAKEHNIEMVNPLPNGQNEYTAHLSPTFYANTTKAQFAALAVSLVQQLERVSLVKVEAAIMLELGYIEGVGCE